MASVTPRSSHRIFTHLRLEGDIHSFVPPALLVICDAKPLATEDDGGARLWIAFWYGSHYHLQCTKSLVVTVAVLNYLHSLLAHFFVCCLAAIKTIEWYLQWDM